MLLFTKGQQQKHSQTYAWKHETLLSIIPILDMKLNVHSWFQAHQATEIKLLYWRMQETQTVWYTHTLFFFSFLASILLAVSHLYQKVTLHSNLICIMCSSNLLLYLKDSTAENKNFLHAWQITAICLSLAYTHTWKHTHTHTCHRCNQHQGSCPVYGSSGNAHALISLIKLQRNMEKWQSDEPTASSFPGYRIEAAHLSCSHSCQELPCCAEEGRAAAGGEMGSLGSFRIRTVWPSLNHPGTSYPLAAS